MTFSNNISVPSTDLRVLVVAEDLLARAGLASLLADQNGIKVVGQTDGLRLDDELDVYQPDVLVWDAGTAGVAGGPLAVQDGLPTVALVADESAASEARRLGVRGVLPRDATPQLIVSAITAVVQGLVVLDPSFLEAFT